MAIVPKRKTSKQRRNKRRTHDALSLPTLTECGNCGKKTQPHHVCKYCGFYKGRNILGK